MWHVYLVRFVLEVMGSVGAAWGASEATTLRRGRSSSSTAAMIIDRDDDTGDILAFATATTITTNSSFGNDELWRLAAIVVGAVFFVRYANQIRSDALASRKRIRGEAGHQSSSLQVVVIDPETNAEEDQAEYCPDKRWLLLALQCSQEFSVRFVLEVLGSCGAIWYGRW